MIIELKGKNYPSYNHLINKLVELEYTRVNMVLEPDEFSVRGNIIDIYSENHSHPVRLEYEDDKLDRLNSFDIHSQRSLSKIKYTTIKKVKANRKKTFSNL